MYKVIRYFTDLQDDNYPYREGDTFPRLGKEVSERRLMELSGRQNRQRKPLIRWVDDEPVEKEQPTRTDIYRMKKAELLETAAGLGINMTEEDTVDELRNAVFEKLGLIGG